MCRLRDVEPVLQDLSLSYFKTGITSFELMRRCYHSTEVSTHTGGPQARQVYPYRKLAMCGDMFTHHNGGKYHERLLGKGQG